MFLPAGKSLIRVEMVRDFRTGCDLYCGRVMDRPGSDNTPEKLRRTSCLGRCLYTRKYSSKHTPLASICKNAYNLQRRHILRNILLSEPSPTHSLCPQNIANKNNSLPNTERNANKNMENQYIVKLD